jgi:hypothetical protein
LNVQIHHPKSQTTQNVHVDRITPFYTNEVDGIEPTPKESITTGTSATLGSPLITDGHRADPVPEVAPSLPNPLSRADTTKELEDLEILGQPLEAQVPSPTTSPLNDTTLEVPRVEQTAQDPINNESEESTELNATNASNASDASDASELEVERIIEYDSGDDEPLYRVRWRGFSAADDTWEPLAHLANANQAVRDFQTQWNSQNPKLPQFPL